MIKQLSLILFSLFSLNLWAQQPETTVSGKVTQLGTHDVLPFVSIFFKGTNQGVTSDFDGNFKVSTRTDADTLVVSYIGYKTRYYAITPHQTQTLRIELESSTQDLHEVVIKPGVNPALRIIKAAQQQKKVVSAKNLTCYEYNTYNKLNVSMNNISDKMKEKKMFAPIRSLFDTVNQFKNEEGKYILPVFVSETYSSFYQHNNPSLQKDVILAHNITGYGTEKQSYVSEILGSNIMQFDFNQNWIRYLAKDFISPIADNSLDYYVYTLVDSPFIDGHKCYEIKLNLKREEDLGFLGTVWIADESFAIKRIDVELARSANINFIDRFKIQQELKETEAGPWIPYKTRTIMDIAQVSKNSSGFIVKSYSFNSNVLVNKPRPLSFFSVAVEQDPEQADRDTGYWKNVRAEEFSATETRMTNMIDSIKKVPAIKTYIDVIRLLVEGHYRVGKFDLGPYVFLVGYNEVEHLRLRFGFRTNQFFSRNWFYRSYLAYGFNDQKFKYGFGIDHILSHRRWTTIGVSTKSDYEILGITDATSTNIQGSGGTNLFAAIAFAAPGSRLNKTVDHRMYMLFQPKRDWLVRLTASRTFFAPVGSFVFAYKNDPGKAEGPGNCSGSFVSTVLSADIRYAYKEVMVNRGVNRIRIQRPKLPALTLSYSQGIKGWLGGDFNFKKIQLGMEEHITTGKFGNADYRIIGGKIFGDLPYPLLDVARGNSTIIYSDLNYGLMNLYEFIADQYAHFYYVQHFEGLFTNRIPIMRKWRIRNFALLKMSYGHLSDANRKLIPMNDGNGKPLSPVYAYGNEPYAEVGFGFENILRFIQLGAVRRLTYLGNTNVRRWGVTFGITIGF